MILNIFECLWSILLIGNCFVIQNIGGTKDLVVIMWFSGNTKSKQGTKNEGLPSFLKQMWTRVNIN